LSEFDIFCHLVSLGIIRFTGVMYQRINEDITVAGVYHQTQFKPVWFEWRDKRYQINQVTLRSKVCDGGVISHLYSVQAGNDIYRLRFFDQEQKWILQQIWVDS
jgi:hypothetical protein